MTRKNQTSAIRGSYKTPCIEYLHGGLEELLCESNEGLTEDLGDVSDFNW